MNPECVCGYTLTYTLHMLSSFRYEQKDNVQVKLFLSNLNIYLLQQQQQKQAFSHIFHIYYYYLHVARIHENKEERQCRVNRAF